MRLIDATPESCEPYLYDHLNDDHMIAAQNAIDDMPTVDTVPVVRCKDCRYCCKEDEWTMWCMSASPACLTTPEDYCSHGRKNDG